ncbi:MAG TPA: hypothetical protein VD978_28760 [Azospirillum sp.]|nr:hypothetical protein [Azospirillum sp.]
MERLLRIATWTCVLLITVLSLLPGEDMVRTSMGGHVEHAVAYAGTTFFAVLAYGLRSDAGWLTIGLIGYAGGLEFLQRYSPGRTPAVEDFLASSAGVLIGLTVALVIRALWRMKLGRA